MSKFHLVLVMLMLGLVRVSHSQLHLGSGVPSANAGKKSRALPHSGWMLTSSRLKCVVPPVGTSLRYTRRVACRWKRFCLTKLGGKASCKQPSHSQSLLSTSEQKHDRLTGWSASPSVRAYRLVCSADAMLVSEQHIRCKRQESLQSA